MFVFTPNLPDTEILLVDLGHDKVYDLSDLDP